MAQSHSFPHPFASAKTPLTHLQKSHSSLRTLKNQENGKSLLLQVCFYPLHLIVFKVEWPTLKKKFLKTFKRGFMSLTAITNDTTNFEPKPQLDRGAPLTAPQADSTATPRSMALSKSIDKYLTHPKFPSFPKDKIEKVFRAFTERMKEYEKVEGPNPFLIKAEERLNAQQKSLKEREKATL